MFKVGQKTKNFSFIPRFPDFVSGKVCFVKRAYKKPDFANIQKVGVV